MVIISNISRLLSFYPVALHTHKSRSVTTGHRNSKRLEKRFQCIILSAIQKIRKTGFFVWVGLSAKTASRAATPAIIVASRICCSPAVLAEYISPCRWRKRDFARISALRTGDVVFLPILPTARRVILERHCALENSKSLNSQLHRAELDLAKLSLASPQIYSILSNLLFLETTSRFLK